MAESGGRDSGIIKEKWLNDRLCVGRIDKWRRQRGRRGSDGWMSCSETDILAAVATDI